MSDITVGMKVVLVIKDYDITSSNVWVGDVGTVFKLSGYPGELCVDFTTQDGPKRQWVETYHIKPYEIGVNAYDEAMQKWVYHVKEGHDLYENVKMVEDSIVGKHEQYLQLKEELGL